MVMGLLKMTTTMAVAYHLRWPPAGWLRLEEESIILIHLTSNEVLVALVIFASLRCEGFAPMLGTRRLLLVLDLDSLRNMVG